MTDTINTAVAEARRIERTEGWPQGVVKRVRVPGAQVGACKQAGNDDQPCILVELYEPGAEEPFDRILCREVDFKGSTTLTQSVGDPCGVTGAIIWLETESLIWCRPWRTR